MIHDMEMGEIEDQKLEESIKKNIEVMQYHWGNQPAAECDSCRTNQSEYKIYTEKNGMRLCLICIRKLKKKLEIFKS